MGVEYIVGDSKAETARLDAGSIALVACSPPFMSLRAYLPAEHPLKHLEMGSESTPAAFIDALLEVTAEWGRVLAPWGSIAIELGDTYSGSGGSGGDYNDGGMRDGQAKFVGSASTARESKYPRVSDGSGGAPIIDRHRDGALAPNGRMSMASAAAGGHHEGGPGWPQGKSLVLIPQLYAIALAYGINPLTGAKSPAGQWRVRNVIVWHRTNPSPGALADKARPSTSYITVATRDRNRWFDLTAVRVPGSTSTHNRIAQGVDARPTTGKTADKDGNFDTLATINTEAGGTAPPLDAWFDEYDGSHDLWTLSTQPSRLAHYAMWPAKLAERLVLMLCPEHVCSVCGEPRRRIEVPNPDAPTRTITAAAEATERARINEYAANRPPGMYQMPRDREGERTITTDRLTMGWSDCGHSSYVRGVTLDPFAGTGTTLAAADLRGRDAIGIDIDINNAALYPRRYDEVKRALFGTKPEMPGQESLFG